MRAQRSFVLLQTMPPTVLTGVVTSAGVMAKTVTMTVARTKVHPKLLKVRVFCVRAHAC